MSAMFFLPPVDRRSKEEREVASVELQQPPTASIGAELPAEQLRGKTDQFEVFMRTASEGRRKQTKMVGRMGECTHLLT